MPFQCIFYWLWVVSSIGFESLISIDDKEHIVLKDHLNMNCHQDMFNFSVWSGYWVSGSYAVGPFLYDSQGMLRDWCEYQRDNAREFATPWVLFLFIKSLLLDISSDNTCEFFEEM